MDLFFALLFTFYAWCGYRTFRRSWSGLDKGYAAYFGGAGIFYLMLAASQWLEVFWLTTGNSPEAMILFFTFCAYAAGGVIWALRRHVRVSWVNHD